MTTSIIMGGAAGRMGQMILRHAADNPDFTIAGGTEYPGSPDIGRSIGDLLNRPELEAPIVEVSPAAVDLGVEIGMAGREALERFR